MNTILQKRIEEAAKTSITETLMSTPNYEFSPKATDMLECAYIKGAEDILNNQWISIDESLPPLDEASSNASIGVIARTSEGVVRYAYYHHYLQQWFSAETSTRIDGVTHWMFVPEEGGKE